MFLLSLLLGGCPQSECEDKSGCDSAEDSDAPVDTDATDTDTGDTDTDEPCLDTGLAQLYFVGNIQTLAGEYAAATAGYGVYSLRDDDWACTLEGTTPYEGPAPDGCPDCDWAFDLGPVEGSVATGAYCDAMGLADGGIDGQLDYSWGFAEVYYYDYNGTPLPLEDTLFLYDDGAWFPFAFNYGGRDWVYGDAEEVDIVRPIFGSGGSYYYYYVPC